MFKQFKQFKRFRTFLTLKLSIDILLFTFPTKIDNVKDLLKKAFEGTLFKENSPNGCLTHLYSQRDVKNLPRKEVR